MVIANSKTPIRTGDPDVVLKPKAQAQKSNELESRYEVSKLLMQGGFGKVLKAWDAVEKKHVAIKNLIRRGSGEAFVHEINILDIIRNSGHKNKNYLLQMKDFFIQGDRHCLVFEYIPFSLYDVINSRKLRQDEVINIGYSILLALEALSQMVEGTRIVHGDLKPDNIMITQHGQVKLIDFGLAFLEKDHTFSFCQTLNFRAPEVYLYNEFGTSIDVWSVACVLAVCHTGKNIFECKKNRDYLRSMAEYFGMIPNEMISSSTSGKIKYYFVRNEQGTWNFNKSSEEQFFPKSKSLSNFLKTRHSIDYDRELLKLLNRMFEYKPSDRITVKQALQHDFFIQCRGQTPLVFANE